MNLDGAAGIQYRIGKSRLNSQLYRIKQEEKAEMRMHNTLKQRFVARYSKPSIDQTVDAPFVKMYETHTPGFCYRRNGECRIPQVQSVSSSLDFDVQNIHNLLFTDGQVDIEKVLCLHLLSAHKTETLKPPTKNDKALSFLAREQSPLERLIERSKKKYQDESLTKLLPRYILDVKSGNQRDDSDIVIRDGRLAERVIINDKINQLVHTVMSALQNTNPDKMKELLEVSNDPRKLAGIFDKPHIQKFINTLNGQLLLYSCDSFHLTQPFKAVTIPLYLETQSKGLAHLVSHIRRNVLQLPMQSTWKAMYNTQLDDDSKVSPREYPENEKEQIDNAPKLKIAQDSKRTKKIDDAANHSAKLKNLPDASDPSAIRKKSDTKVKDKTQQLPKYMSFIKDHKTKKSSKVPAKTHLHIDQQSISPNESDGEASGNNSATERMMVNNIFKTVDIATVATALSEKAEAAIKKDMEEFETRSIHEAEVSKSPVDPNSKPAKVSIKQMNCVACMQKWKNPLPLPKIPKLKKVSIPVLEEMNYTDFRSNSAHHLSVMIDREMKKLASEDKKHAALEKQRAIVQPYKNTKQRRNLTMQFLDGIEIDILDLAKISQEIKEKETKKKLEEFLNTKL